MKFPFVPKVAGWELTRRCNMNCIHCGSSAGEAHEGELLVEEGERLCDDLADLGCQILTLSGGEPLLHPAWDRYAERLAHRGVRTFMITNGFLIKENLQRILASPVRRIGVSIDGCTVTAYSATGSCFNNPYCLYRVERELESRAEPAPATSNTAS